MEHYTQDSKKKEATIRGLALDSKALHKSSYPAGGIIVKTPFKEIADDGGCFVSKAGRSLFKKIA